MSKRDGFEPGVPCWIDTWQPDADAAVAFYAALFGGTPPRRRSTTRRCAT